MAPSPLRRPRSRSRRRVTTDSLRQDLSIDLPPRIEDALRAYACIADDPPSPDLKEFTARQSACKAALAHTEMLLKLLKWAESAAPPLTSPLAGGSGPPPGDGTDDTTLYALLARASQALGPLEDEEEDGCDDEQDLDNEDCG